MDLSKKFKSFKSKFIFHIHLVWVVHQTVFCFWAIYLLPYRSWINKYSSSEYFYEEWYPVCVILVCL